MENALHEVVQFDDTPKEQALRFMRVLRVLAKSIRCALELVVERDESMAHCRVSATRAELWDGGRCGGYTMAEDSVIIELALVTAAARVWRRRVRMLMV